MYKCVVLFYSLYYLFFLVFFFGFLSACYRLTVSLSYSVFRVIFGKEVLCSLLPKTTSGFSSRLPPVSLYSSNLEIFEGVIDLLSATLPLNWALLTD